MNLEGVNSREIMSMLSGAPTETIFLDEKNIQKNELFSFLEKNLQIKNPITASSKNSNFCHQDFEILELSQNHSYYLISTERDLEDKKYVVLGDPRNPKISKKIEFSKFLIFFAEIQICYYKEKSIYTADRFYTPAYKPSIIQFVPKESGIFNFSFFQISKNYFQKKSNYSYSPITILAMKTLPTGQLEFLRSIRSQERDIPIILDIQKNEKLTFYVNFIFFKFQILTNWVSFVNELTVSIYGPEAMGIQALEPEGCDSQMVVDQVEQKVTQRPQEDRISRYFTDFLEPKISYFFEDFRSGFAVLGLQNYSENTIFDALVSGLSYSDCELGNNHIFDFYSF